MTIAFCFIQQKVKDGTCQTHFLYLPEAGKLPRRKRSGNVGQQLSEHEHEPAVCPDGQEGQWYFGLCQK